MAKTYDELHAAAHSRLNLRKAQRSLALIGRRSEVTKIDWDEFGPGELPDFKEMGFHYVGRVTTDGWTFGREEENDEVESHGFTDPGRIDTTSVTRTISTTVQETFRRVIRELIKGADYSGVSFNESGFLVLDEPDFPEHDEWSLITMFRDNPEDRRIVFGRHFGSIQLETAGEEAFGNEGAIQQEITWRVFPDEDMGTPFREFYGGPGMVQLAETLGYKVTGQSGNGGEEPDEVEAESFAFDRL